MINRDLKRNEGTKLFTWWAANVQARLNKIWPARKKCHLQSTYCNYHKNSILPFFQDFISNLQTFSRSGKLLRKLEEFFKISRLCTNPVRDYKRVSSVLLTCSFANNTSPILVTVMPLCCKALNSISQSYQATGTRLSSSDSLIPLRAVIIWRKICTMQQREIMTNHCIKDTMLYI